MKYIAVLDDDFLQYFRLDDDGKTVVFQDKHLCTRAVKLTPLHGSVVVEEGYGSVRVVRRKGTWERMSDLSEEKDDRYKCSNCGNVVHHANRIDLYTFNAWCGRCGSDNNRDLNNILFDEEEGIK